jgi:predicted membrane protein
LDHDIPQQFDTKSSNGYLPIYHSNLGTAKKTQAVFQVMESGMTGSLVVNFFLAAFMGIAMKQIWGIINTL